MKNLQQQNDISKEKTLKRHLWIGSSISSISQLIISISDTHNTNMDLDSSGAYISVFSAFLTNSFWLQAVEWQCDEATKRACYSKGKSKVSMRQLFWFNKNFMLIADVIQCIDLYLVHFYCLPFWREMQERSLTLMCKQRNKEEHREHGVRDTVTWFLSEMTMNFSCYQFIVLTPRLNMACQM